MQGAGMRNNRTRDRQENILRILSASETVSVQELAERLKVSGWTIRRDLDQLRERDLIKRRHDSAVINSELDYELLLPEDVQLEAHQNLAAKRRIGLKAAGLLQAGQNIVLSAGTTTTQCALALKERKALSVLTHALNIAMELSVEPGLKVSCTGGDADSHYFTLVGPVAERSLKAHFFEVAVIGVSEISRKAGLTVRRVLNAAAMEIRLNHSSKVIVLADSTRPGVVGFVHLAPLDKMDMLVTDVKPPKAFCEQLAQSGVKLVIAPE